MFNSEEKKYELPLYDSPEEQTTPEKFECSEPFHPRFSRFGFNPPPPPHHFHGKGSHKRCNKGKSRSKKIVIGSSLALAGFSLFSMGRLYEDHIALQNIHVKNHRGFECHYLGEEYPEMPDFPHPPYHMRKGRPHGEDYPPAPPCELPLHKPKHHKPKHHKTKHHKEHNETDVEEILRTKHLGSKHTELDENFEGKEHGKKFRGKEHRPFEDNSYFSDSSDDEEFEGKMNEEPKHHKGKKLKGKKHGRQHGEKNRDNEKHEEIIFEAKHQEEKEELKNLKNLQNHNELKEHNGKPENEKEIPENVRDEEQNNEKDAKAHKEFKHGEYFKSKNQKKPAEEGTALEGESDMLSEMEEIFSNVRESIDNIVKSGFSLASA